MTKQQFVLLQYYFTFIAVVPTALMLRCNNDIDTDGQL